jgi:excisionase family DNA binding protein
MSIEKMPQPNDDMLTPGEVATMLGVSVMTVNRLVRSNDLQAVIVTPRARRFKRVEVIRYIQDHTTSGVHHGD